MQNEKISRVAAEKLIEMVYRSTRRAVIPLLLALGLCCLIVSEKVEAKYFMLWAVVSSIAVLARLYLVGRMATNRILGYELKLKTVALLSVITGLSCGSILLFFPLLDAFERAMLTLVLVSICSGAIITNSGYRPLFLSFTLPVLGGLSLAWGLNPHHVVGSVLASIVSIMIIVMLVTFVVMSQETFNAFAMYVKATERQIALTNELSLALNMAEVAQENAENSDNSKSRFLAAASHDLRQPVYVLTLYSAVLARAEVSQETRKVIDNMNIAVESLSSEIETLLDISRLDSGVAKPDKTAVNLKALVDKLEPSFSKLATSKGIVFKNNMLEPCVAWTDADMLSRMLRNICGNAIKYTNDGSVTLTALKCEMDGVVVSIADTGIGISKENLAHVLEEFYQISNPERDNGMGLGLGLSIVDRLAKSLGHELSISSVQGCGTEVSIKMHAGNLDAFRSDRELETGLDHRE